jgi:hypothetical protein
MAELLIKRTYTQADLVKTREHPGRRHGKPHGSYVIDLADLRKVVILCPACNSKFDWKRHHFRKEKEFPCVVSKCDACKVVDSYCSMYIADETYTKVRSTAEDRRTEARNFWRGRIWKRSS